MPVFREQKKPKPKKKQKAAVSSSLKDCEDPDEAIPGDVQPKAGDINKGLGKAKGLDVNELMRQQDAALADMARDMGIPGIDDESDFDNDDSDHSHSSDNDDNVPKSSSLTIDDMGRFFMEVMASVNKTVLKPAQDKPKQDEAPLKDLFDMCGIKMGYTPPKHPSDIKEFPLVSRLVRELVGVDIKVDLPSFMNLQHLDEDLHYHPHDLENLNMRSVLRKHARTKTLDATAVLSVFCEMLSKVDSDDPRVPLLKDGVCHAINDIHISTKMLQCAHYGVDITPTYVALKPGILSVNNGGGKDFATTLDILAVRTVPVHMAKTSGFTRNFSRNYGNSRNAGRVTGASTKTKFRKEDDAGNMGFPQNTGHFSKDDDGSLKSNPGGNSGIDQKGHGKGKGGKKKKGKGGAHKKAGGGKPSDDS